MWSYSQYQKKKMVKRREPLCSVHSCACKYVYVCVRRPQLCSFGFIHSVLRFVLLLWFIAVLLLLYVTKWKVQSSSQYRRGHELDQHNNFRFICPTFQYYLLLLHLSVPFCFMVNLSYRFSLEYIHRSVFCVFRWFISLWLLLLLLHLVIWNIMSEKSAKMCDTM